MTPTILYQDDDILVLNKPPGMVVNRAESVKSQTVQDWIEKQSPHLPISPSPNLDIEFQSRSGIVHRIDKETSGILLIAKNPASFIELQRQFKERMVKKTYLALVHGNVPAKGEIRVPVGRVPWNREQFGVVPGGKEAVTKFKRVKSYAMPAGRQEVRGKNKDEKISLVEVYPETGRTHQIRVHFKYLGYPLVGDYLYAGRKQSRDDREWAGRVMLHAWKITFSHPKTHGTLAFVAPIPDDMNRIINPTNTTNAINTTNK